MSEFLAGAHQRWRKVPLSGGVLGAVSPGARPSLVGGRRSARRSREPDCPTAARRAEVRRGEAARDVGVAMAHHHVGMRELPSGTVTFLFTDVEGSTRLLHELGAERYAEALAEHRRALREAFVLHGGVEVDTQGDAFFVAFARASDAVAAAEEGQSALDSGRVRVRMGLHTGEPVVTEEGYVGADVHRAARIAAVGHGGQVLLSRTTRDLVQVVVRDLGDHRLKDLGEPVRVFQLGGGISLVWRA
jgi:class 3 adenylate cyclase